jgi:hypothetical protein
VLEESNNPIVPRSLAQGLWEKTGPREFRRTWVYFRFDSFTLPRAFIGTSNNVATLTLTEDGSEFYAEAIVELRGAAGAFEATRTFSRSAGDSEDLGGGLRARRRPSVGLLAVCVWPTVARSI